MNTTIDLTNGLTTVNIIKTIITAVMDLVVYGRTRNGPYYKTYYNNGNYNKPQFLNLPNLSMMAKALKNVCLLI